MEFTRPADQKHIIQCESSLNHVTWGSACAAVGESIKLNIGTSFMGLGSEVKLTFKDQRGRKVLELEKPVYADRVATTIDIPEKVKSHLICEAILSTNGKSLQSTPLIIVPQRKVHELSWSQTSVRRGDVVTLKAQSMGFVSGRHALIHIYEYDQSGAHQPIAELQTSIVNGAIKVMWQFQYRGDTKDILTEAECVSRHEHYQAPSYFWVAEVDGLRYGELGGQNKQNSGLLAFDKDDLEIKLHGYAGLSNSDYIIILADGTDVKGTLSSDGIVKLIDVAPGPVQLKISNLASAIPQPLVEIMPKGSIPLPVKIPNYQTQAANSTRFNEGWGWKRFALLKNATWVGIASSLLMSGSMKIERWQASGYEYVYYVDDNILTINKDQQTYIKLLVQNNELIEITDMTPDHKPILGATIGVINALGLVATIVAALDDNLYLRWRMYQADGGDNSFEVWFNSGKPLDVEIEIPVRAISRESSIDVGSRDDWPFEVFDVVVPGKNVTKQVDSLACGFACGQMLSKESGSEISQQRIMNWWRKRGFPATINVEDLARFLQINTNDKWVGGYPSLPISNLELVTILNTTGSWGATVRLPNSRVDHMIVIDGFNSKGELMIRDPWDGSNLSIGWDDFSSVWNGNAVWRQ